MPKLNHKGMLVANWKMHGSLDHSQKWAEEFLTQPLPEDLTIVVCPPYLYIPRLSALFAGSAVALGAQNLSAYHAGAYTGEISAAMLKDFACRYVIIGHSERRALYGEQEEQISTKLRLAIDHSLVPILCVGETLEQRQSGQTEMAIAKQLDGAIAVLRESSAADYVVAYEPVWAIGSGQTATPEQAQQVHGYIRDYLIEQMGSQAQQLKIIYGGSINAQNAAALFAMDDIAGGLVGGASLKAKSFGRIRDAFL